MPELKNITKKYGDLTVFDNFNLKIEDGITTAIMGSSGIGKTTLLNIVAGLTPYEGIVEKSGNVSYVFQEPRLIDTLTVRENLLFVMKNCKMERKQLESEVEKMLTFGEILDKKNSYPQDISGGQKQRVSLLRAFLYPSDIMLMDEPFSSLDISLKMRIMKLYKDLLLKKPRTVLFVSHDIDEALSVADEIIVIGKSQVKLRCKIEKSEGLRDLSDENLNAIRKQLYDALL